MLVWRLGMVNAESSGDASGDFLASQHLYRVYVNIKCSYFKSIGLLRLLSLQ